MIPCYFYRYRFAVSLSVLFLMSCQDLHSKIKLQYKARVSTTSIDNHAGRMMFMLHDSTLLQISRSINSSDAFCPTEILDSIDLKPEKGDEGAVFYSYQVPYGEVQVLKWQEGFNVMLAEGSVIKFTDAGPGKTRAFYLQGRAIFNPADSDTSNFMIQLPDSISILTHGKKVYVNNLKGSPGRLIQGYRGGVEVIRNYFNTVLNDSDGLDAQLNPLRYFDRTLDIEWTNAFKLDYATLPEILDEVQHWYNRDIQVEGRDAGIEMSGMMRRYPIDSVLSEICTGYHVKLHVGGCKTPMPFANPSSRKK
jgi:hypothetical protein